LLAADDELIVLDRDIQFLAGKPGNGQGDPQLFWPGLLDVVGRLTIAGGLRRALQQPLQVVESEEEWAVESAISVHQSPP